MATNLPVSEEIKLVLIGTMKDGTPVSAAELDKAVWTSSDPSIAYIEGNLFVPIKEGIVTVTATLGELTAKSVITIGSGGVARVTVTTQEVIAELGSIIDINVG